VLLVRPERAGALLPRAIRELGAELDAVVFYRNVAPPDVGETARMIREDRYDVVVFASPSALEHLLRADAPERGIVEALRRLSTVAIGSVTAAALEQAGIPPGAVARRPSNEGILEAVCSLFA
jgi:uroporphyrinogen-III synthase